MTSLVLLTSHSHSSSASPRASWYIIGLHLLLVGFLVDMGASWLHGVCKENSFAPSIRRLRLPLYRTCGDNSVLFDHDLERMEGWFATNADTISLKYWYKVLKLQLVAAS